MLSILTNISAQTALQSLRAISARSEEIRQQASTGLRVAEASQGAAYWSIATTMRSDCHAISSVVDAMAVTAGIADVTYTALETVGSTLAEIRSRFVAAAEDGVDKAKLQAEVDQLVEHVFSIARNASFSGQNWLATDIPDFFDSNDDKRIVSFPSGYIRDGQGKPSIGIDTLDLLQTSLINSTGGGILQGDIRSPGTIGGLRYRIDGGYATPRHYGSQSVEYFDFSGPLHFDDPSDQISFVLTVDAEDPSDPGLPGPYDSGQTFAVMINRAMVLAALPDSDGEIADYKDMITVLSRALSGIPVSARYVTTFNATTHKWEIVENAFALVNSGISALPGSSMSLSSLSGNVGGFGGLDSFVDYRGRAADLSLHFEPFKVYQGVEISFGISVNDLTGGPYMIDRAVVDAVTGRDDGRIETADEMLALLQSLVTDIPGFQMSVEDATIRMELPGTVDRTAGANSHIRITHASVNVEPLDDLALADMDVAAMPDRAEEYVESVTYMIDRVADAASVVGAMRKRISLQNNFLSRLEDSMERGVSKLVDADMEKTAARLRAVEAQKQLALQALSVANGRARVLLSLFEMPG
ncbi:flagellin [Oricola thermophila]|uniref:Flagellin n=1 Tax=Oricola thermophila TaxID=2742145 RepID=A0A6N1VH26_9HYPH|nr:flagellin [Oricola thermophila]QKV18592.1 flagellin/flagellar hook associated protein [Oricola thermophila]